MANTPLALVTGGNRGIGLQIARALQARGFSLALVARDAERLRQAAQALPDRTTTLALDLTEPDAVARIEAWLSGQPVAVLVNNAGEAPSDRFEATTPETLRRTLALHVEIPFALTRVVLPGMKALGGGTIVQVASTAGLRGFAFTAAYCAAKHAAVGMTRALAVELGNGPVRVYAICPGFVDTDLTRAAAARVAARGRQTAADVLAGMARLNVIGRLHAADEVATFVGRLCDERPQSGVFDLDREPPARVD